MKKIRIIMSILREKSIYSIYLFFKMDNFFKIKLKMNSFKNFSLLNNIKKNFKIDQNYEIKMKAYD